MRRRETPEAQRGTHAGATSPAPGGSRRLQAAPGGEAARSRGSHEHARYPRAVPTCSARILIFQLIQRRIEMMTIIRVNKTPSTPFSLRHENATDSPRSRMTTVSSHWLLLLMMLMLLQGLLADKERVDTSSTTHAPSLEVAHPLRIVNATNTSLTMMVNPDACDDCMVHWEYQDSTANDWRDAGIESAKKEKVIGGLRPNTKYTVAANFLHNEQRKGGKRTTAKGHTCSDYPDNTAYGWCDDKGTDFLTMRWVQPGHLCISDRFLISWKENENAEYSYETASSPAECPVNATLLSNLTMYECEDLQNEIQYCFTVKDGISLGTRYIFKVVTVNALGVCSAPTSIYTASRTRYYGVGFWVLGLFGALLLVAGVSALYIFIRRRSVRRASEGRVAFSVDNREAHIGESAGEYAPPEPFTRLAKKNVDLPHG